MNESINCVLLNVKKSPCYITKSVLLIVALQLLNLSIYAQDFKTLSNKTAETNICESVLEYVLEVVLQHKNAIPEQSQHHKDLHFHKHISFKAISFGIPVNTTYAYSIKKIEVVPLKLTYAYQYLQEINPPPPKV